MEGTSSSQETMEKASHGHVIGIPVRDKAYGIEEADMPGEGSTSDHHGHFVGSFSSKSKHDTESSTTERTRDKLAQGIKEHVTLGPKLSETVKGKLTLGARILQAGGLEKAFHQWFSGRDGEKLLKASQCHLWTTAGPIAGMLFVSTEKIAFRSDRPLAVTSPTGGTIRVPYKVVIPLRRVKGAKPSENKHRPEQKYIHVATNDGFEFWFMGFVRYQTSLRHLEQAIAQSQCMAAHVGSV